MDLLKEIKNIEGFNDLPERQLQWIVENSTLQELKTGELLFSVGTAIDTMHMIISGRIVLKLQQNNQFRTIGYLEPYTVSGVLPYSRAERATAVGEALENVTVLCLPKSCFREMIREHEELTTTLVHIMSSRIRDFTKRQQQDDKMMALGKLSAGLAHELNNPSAAVVRSAQELKKHLGFLPEGFKKVIKIRTSEEQVDLINEMVFTKTKRGVNLTRSMMEKADLESELLDWLDDHEVENPDEIAEILTEFDFAVEDLDLIKDNLRGEDLFPVLNWVTQVMTTEKLVNEIEEASGRINKLVSSVKSYTHMDQAPEKEKTDIHIGIKNTLTMLNHKLKKSSVDIVESFEKDLPKANIFVSELNQVWTNLIDNAIDAMEDVEKKTLELKTTRQGDFVNVSIIDSGNGIPEDIQGKIFDPFFTTKKVGKGTGLGLDVVRQIVSQHNGDVRLDSKPGRTEFLICIPF